MRGKIIFLCFLLFFQLEANSEDSLIQLKTAIHMSSSISSSKSTLEEITEIAKDNGIQVVVFTDRDLMRWEYGLWPLRNIIKKKVESNSIFRYGIESYLEEIGELQNKFPDMILIPGAESAPFYYWEGSPLRGDLKMCNWHKHILAVGLETYEDYDNLPVVGNPKGLRKNFSVYKLWPFLTLILGILCLRKRQHSYKDYNGRELGPYSKKWRVFGGFIIVLTLLVFLNNWPFSDLLFDQYHGDLGSMPYQNFIDYVNKKGGLTFWAHPEAEYISKMGEVSFETREHTYELLEIEDYTGFSIFYEGYGKVGKPGGIWDGLLVEYCRGLRENPIWAICGLAFDVGGLSRRMRDLQAIILAPERSREAVLEALKGGRVYVIRGERGLDFSLDKFFLSDESGRAKGFVGDNVEIEGRPVLHIEGSFLNDQQEVEVKIIKGGKVVKVYKVESPFQITYYDDNIVHQKSYYRLEIRGKGWILVTNPIFVQ